MKKRAMPAALLLILSLLSSVVYSNNITISGLVVHPVVDHENDSHSIVEFSLSGDNSWRSNTTGNWDAAWIFGKYRIDNGEWRHLKLNNAGHSHSYSTYVNHKVGLLKPDMAFDRETNPGMGVFLYRSASNTGSGSYSISSIKLRWNWDDDVKSDDVVDVRVFAIEMVYVPSGDFWVGDGGSSSGRFIEGGTVNTPFQITASWNREIKDEEGKLWGVSTSGHNSIGLPGSLNADFPTGLDGFYCMKYELTQQQYVDFLNTLTQTQANTRKSVVGGHRYAITGSSVGSYSTSHPHLPHNYMKWSDALAYADWAGLRPMTELEFEKACRGLSAPVANEFSWGTTSYTNPSGLDNAGQANEIAFNSTANSRIGYSTTVESPVRVGAFAKTATDRAQSGSSYWGIMELSGNVYELVVNVSQDNGRNFSGLHGNGILTDKGLTTISSWPVTTGFGQRGGCWSTSPSNARVSDRQWAIHNSGWGQHGFRAVRSLPAN